MVAPIIVLGLGGIGSEIVAKLERKVEEKKFKGEVLFAAIDTDINTLSRIQREGFGGCLVQLSKNMTVKEYLNSNTEYKEWFFTTDGLNIKSMTEGAGQVRAISRLAFDVALRNGALDKLEEEIQHTFQISGRISYQTPRIFIVSSLAGGTGSGIVLPLALYIRRFFSEVMHSNAVIVKGMFIMPEVFRYIIGSDFEQVSIEANAYAAIKELDAFIKKSEGYLSERFNDKLYLKLPVKAAAYSENYITLPYNYCYLFGGKNESGNSLRSFEDYLKFAVECIYAQAFSPMQQLNNSIEDNVFRIVTSGIDGKMEDGFQRFCSAGTSVLVYPYEELVEMLALRKAGTILSVQWSQVDKEYFRECQRTDTKRAQGKHARHQARKEFYVKYIEEQNKANPFIDKIYKDVMEESQSQENEIYLKEKWHAYWEALEVTVKSWSSGTPSLEKRMNNFEVLVDERSFQRYHRTKEYINTLKSHFDELVRDIKEEVEKKRRTVGSRFFGARTDEGSDDKSYYVYWLKADGQFIHPNAVRYFLYKTLDLFQEKKENLKVLIAGEQEQLQLSQDRAIDKVNFSSNPLWNDVFHRDEMKKVRGQLEEGFHALDNYRQHILLEQIAEKGIELFTKLAKEYEEFYDVFDYNVQQYFERAEDIKYRLQETKGTVTRYVGCDDQTLSYMENTIIDTRNNVEIDGEISEMIFDTILLRIGKEDYIEDYHKVFQYDFISHWKEELRRDYDYILNMDVVEAMAKEKECNVNHKGTVENYINERVNDMWVLAGPFVRTGSKQLTKRFCTYSHLLDKGKDQIRNHILQTLKDGGGSVDMDGVIDQYTIMFYQVVYGLAAYDITEMAIVWDESKKDYYVGSMGKSYYQMLENTKKSKLTPHIDWNWNRFDVLPEFNTSYQMYLEDMTYRMFIYKAALKLSVSQVGNDNEKYQFNFAGKMEGAGTIHQLLVDFFINDLAQVIRWKNEMDVEITDFLRLGKQKEEFPFFKERSNWGKQLNGIFGIIYRVNTDGGINHYDSSMLKNMVCAFMNLLWEIATRFDRPESAKALINTIVEEEKTKFKAEKQNFNSKIAGDIEGALDNKLQEMRL